MLFNSIEFAIFLPIVFIIYWLLSKNLKLQNIFVVLASYVFYAWWDYRFLLLLFGMSFLSWVSGWLITHHTLHITHKGLPKLWLTVNIILNLSILAIFKYYNFFVSSFADLFGLQNSIHSLKIVLPLGISFFTFQAISYVVDVYKRKIDPTNLIDCLFYIGFFPKLLAGPIERPTNLIPQIQKNRVFEYNLAVDGCRQMLWGLFKKVVIADNCALYVNQVYGDYTHQSGSTLLLSAILYTIQIYGDFSGYSDMAIGSAKLLGFRFRDNFLFPYFSRNMNEFWHRWHISLNTWFVDYVYIPLGGSRNGKWHTIRNIMIVFLLSGLWHGADWSFVAWGAYHGLLLVLLILLNRNTKYEHVVAYDRALPSFKEVGQMLLVFALATFGWMMFRADNMSQFVDYIGGMWQWGTLRASYRFFMPNQDIVYPVNVFILVILCVEWIWRNKSFALSDIQSIPAFRNRYVRIVLYAFLLLLTFMFRGGAVDFIYFQF